MTGAYESYKLEKLGSLAPKTQKNYENAAKLISHKTSPVSEYMPEDIKKLLHKLPPGAYMVARTFFSSLFSFSIAKGWTQVNPVHHVPTRPLGTKKRWQRAEVPKGLETLPERSRAVLEAMYETGQRLSDILKIGPSNLDGNVLSLFQQKTGNKIVMRLSDRLAQTLLANETRPGYPFFTVRAYQVYRDWRRVKGSLGMEGLTPHGLRKSASCEAAEGGATEAMLQALLGHKTSRAATLYRMEADQGKLAAMAQGCRK